MAIEKGVPTILVSPLKSLSSNIKTSEMSNMKKLRNTNICVVQRVVL